jgi:hypothetical protein
LDHDFLRNRPKESTNNPTIRPNTIASTGNPGIPGPGGAAAEVDSEWVDDEVGTVLVVVGIVDVVVVVGCWVVVVVITA